MCSTNIKKLWKIERDMVRYGKKCNEKRTQNEMTTSATAMGAHSTKCSSTSERTKLNFIGGSKIYIQTCIFFWFTAYHSSATPFTHHSIALWRVAMHAEKYRERKKIAAQAENTI